MVDLPAGKKLIGYRWIFTIKYKTNGDIERYEAQLMVKGYSQTYGIDYEETFAPVAKINTICILLSLAVNFDWPLHKYDVKNALYMGISKKKYTRSCLHDVNYRLKEANKFVNCESSQQEHGSADLQVQ